MRHQVSGRKLGRTTSHRTAMLRNMAASLFQHERITTTVQKAKELRPFAEKLITLAKKETLHARRQVLRHIKDREVVKKLFETIGIRYATRPGGYTRIIRTEFRRGDNAEMAIIELVDTKMSATKPKKKAAPAAKKTQKVQKSAEAEHKEAAPEEAEAVDVVEEPGVESEPAEAEAEPAEAKADTAEESSSEEKPEEKSGEEDKKE